MNRRIRRTLGLLLTSVLMAVSTVGGAAGGPQMPPRFTLETDVTVALRNYPLGEITAQVAFSHHGEPDRKVVLPNGKEGWVYAVHQTETRTYRLPSGEERTVDESKPGPGSRTYTLEFDDGVVIDVLYNEQGRHDGLTALQLQRDPFGADE